MTPESAQTVLDLLAAIRERDAQIRALRLVVSVALETIGEQDRSLKAARRQNQSLRDEIRFMVTGERRAEEEPAA